MYSLTSSPLTAELAFTDTFTRTQQKLALIYSKYELEESKAMSCNNPCAVQSVTAASSPSAITVDRIKKVAATGFEAAKITNIISRFAHEQQLVIDNTITPPLGATALIQRHLNGHPYLDAYRPAGTLQATLVVDLILGMPNNYDICFNILNMLRKTWPQIELGESSTPPIGYCGFFANLVDCLRLHKTMNGREMGARELIANTADTLRPLELTEKIARRQCYTALRNLASSEWDSTEKLKILMRQFDFLGGGGAATTTTTAAIVCEFNYFHRVHNFVLNVTRLVQFQMGSSVSAPPLMTATQLLRTNLSDIVGRIVFECGIIPSEIETHCMNVHLNLVYELVQKTCPRIEYDHHHHRSSPQHNETLIGQICSMVTDDECDGNGATLSPMDSKLYQIENPHIFDYVQKHNGMVVALMRHIQSGRFVDVSASDECVRHLMMNLNDVEHLASIYRDNNRAVAALKWDIFNIETIAEFIRNSKDYL